MPFAGQTVVVTGAAGGIGAHTARRFAAAGAQVALCDINEQDLTRTALDLPGSLARRVDITDRQALAEFVDACVQRFGGIDVWINNATSCTDTPFLQVTPEQLYRDIEVNLIAPFLAAQLVVPRMVAQGGGVILNVASVNALGYFGNDAYSAAKAGLISLTRGIAVQFSGQGVRCVALAPSTIETEHWAHRIAVDPHVLEQAAQWYPAGRIGQVDDVSDALLFLASPQAAWITGTVITLDGGLLAGNLAMARGIVPDPGSQAQS